MALLGMIGITYASTYHNTNTVSRLTYRQGARMGDLGKRLKQERERLGMSQEKFGAACGVGKTAQYMYERGTREPTSGYLDAAGKLGVDTLYVMTGRRGGENWSYLRAYGEFLRTIELLLGVEQGRMERLCSQLAELAPEVTSSAITSKGIEIWADCIKEVGDWLGTATTPWSCLDLDLLARLLDAIGDASLEAGCELSTPKRLHAAVMLYRDAKTTGQVDRKAVVEMVKLAG
jgi:transcriptional regulator with XRE-family HTH domain